MNIIKLSYTDEVTLVDDDDFEKLNLMGQWLLHQNKTNKYAVLAGHNKLAMHNVILPPPIGLEVDHINRNGLDNQKSNLRHATRSQNNMNKDLNKNNTSGFKGVSWMERLKKFRAYVVKDYKQETIGYYKTAGEAAIAYNKRAKELYGEFVKLNDVSP